jgi:uncharacterized protein YaeQ
MAISATIHAFEVQLSDVDRGVYEALSMRVARHPSESAEYLVARVLAYCLEYAEGIVFSRGVSDPDEPTLSVRDLTGVVQSWIEIGAPDAARLHRASKAATRVAVYTHKDAEQLVRRLAGERIHRAEEVEVYGIDRALVADLVARLDRRMVFELAVSGGHLYVTMGGESLAGAVTRYALA